VNTQNLKILRQICGLTQFELAAKAKISIHRIARAEQGLIVLSSTEEKLVTRELQRHWKWLSAVTPEGLLALRAEVSALINGQFERALADNGPKRIKTRSEVVQ
jgi:transcriptional regulator with XRE-family HTH domain